jgi:hypothetical protein
MVMNLWVPQNFGNFRANKQLVDSQQGLWSVGRAGLAGWLVGWLAGWLVGWLVGLGWFGRSVGWFGLVWSVGRSVGKSLMQYCIFTVINLKCSKPSHYKCIFHHTRIV